MSEMAAKIRCWALPLQHLVQYRRLSTIPPQPVKNAAEAAAALKEKLAGQVAVRTEELDRTQLRKLALTLDRPIRPSIDPRAEIPRDQAIPPGYHLVYFTGGDVEEDLAPDGSDTTFNPPGPFTRRMWAGGRMAFERENALRTDTAAEEHTRLVGATAKRSRAGEEMLLVEVEKRYYCGGRLSVTDSRSWIFRGALREGVTAQRAADGDVLEPSCCEQVDARDGFPVWNMSWSPVGLFRFSALTFNGHKIHYDEDWTRTREGHPRPVVHGPLNLINLLDYWAAVHGRPGTGPREVVYRALSPVFAGERYRIRTAGDEVGEAGRKADVLAEREGIAVMKASIWG